MNFERFSKVDTMSRKILISAVRNEGPFILEWVAYHRAIGFDHIILCSNNCEDGSESLLAALAAEGIISHRHRDYPPDQDPQYSIINDLTDHPLIRKDDWIMVLDADEFLNIDLGNGQVNALLSVCPDADAVMILWKNFGDSGYRTWTHGSVIERFTGCEGEIREWNRFHKTIFRNNGKFGRLNAHYPSIVAGLPLHDLRVCNTRGEIYDTSLLDPADLTLGKFGCRRDMWTWENARVHHYSVKTLDLLRMKRYRGDNVPGKGRSKFAPDSSYAYAGRRNDKVDLSIHRMLPRMNQELEILRRSRLITTAEQAMQVAFDALRSRVLAMADLDGTGGVAVASLPKTGAEGTQLESVILLTYHGTVVYKDDASGRLRHGKLGEVPLNVRFSVDMGTVTYHAHEALRAHNGRRTATPSLADAAVTVPGWEGVARAVSGHYPSAIGISANGAFLCAQQDGTLVLDRKHFRDWENFLPVSLRMALDLVWILQNRWLLSREKIIVGPATTRIAPRFVLSFAGHDISLCGPGDGGLLTQRRGESLDGRCRAFSYIYDEWKVGFSVLYKPLIYFAAFVNDEVFLQLRESIRSIEEFGKYDGNYIVVTDRSAVYVKELLPEIAVNRIEVITKTSARPLDYNGSRYDLRSSSFDEFQPILYLDTDIACGGNMAGLMTELAEAEKICVSIEKGTSRLSEMPDDWGKWFGKDLFVADGSFAWEDFLCINAGSFGASHADVIRIYCEQVRRLREIFENQKKGQDYYPCQPVFNYVLHANGIYNVDILGRHVATVGNQPPSHVLKEALVHFNTGIGRAGKHEAMRKYIDIVRNAPAARDAGAA